MVRGPSFLSIPTSCFFSHFPYLAVVCLPVPEFPAADPAVESGAVVKLLKSRWWNSEIPSFPFRDRLPFLAFDSPPYPFSPNSSHGCRRCGLELSEEVLVCHPTSSHGRSQGVEVMRVHHPG